MSFGLTPREHLDFLIEERNLLRRELSSTRMGVNCCVWANHLPEIVFAAYESASPEKVYDQAAEKEYRDHVVSLHPDLGLIRDLCDFAKHGPRLRRKGVQVSNTQAKETFELNGSMMMMGFPHHEEVLRLVVTLNNGEERWLDALVDSAVDFWKNEFDTKAL
jgi:hypothetical protein